MNMKLSICIYDTLTEDKIKEFLSLVSQDRQERILKATTADKKTQLLLAGLLTLKELTELSGLSKEELDIKVLDSGKPILCNAINGKSDLGFSLSHTPGVVAFYGGLSQACGIDVEAMPPADDMDTYVKKIGTLEQIAKRYFTREELDFVFERETFLPSRFYMLWTKKEAYGKLTGNGLADMEVNVLSSLPASIQSLSFHIPEKRAYLTAISTKPIDVLPTRYTAEALLESF